MCLFRYLSSIDDAKVNAFSENARANNIFLFLCH